MQQWPPSHRAPGSSQLQRPLQLPAPRSSIRVPMELPHATSASTYYGYRDSDTQAPSFSARRYPPDPHPRSGAPLRLTALAKSPTTCRTTVLYVPVRFCMRVSAGPLACVLRDAAQKASLRRPGYLGDGERCGSIWLVWQPGGSGGSCRQRQPWGYLIVWLRYIAGYEY